MQAKRGFARSGVWRVSHVIGSNEMEMGRNARRDGNWEKVGRLTGWHDRVAYYEDASEACFLGYAGDGSPFYFLGDFLVDPFREAVFEYHAICVSILF